MAARVVASSVESRTDLEVSGAALIHGKEVMEKRDDKIKRVGNCIAAFLLMDWLLGIAGLSMLKDMDIDPWEQLYFMYLLRAFGTAISLLRGNARKPWNVPTVGARCCHAFLFSLSALSPYGRPTGVLLELGIKLEVPTLLLNQGLWLKSNWPTSSHAVLLALWERHTWSSSESHALCAYEYAAKSTTPSSHLYLSY